MEKEQVYTLIKAHKIGPAIQLLYKIFERTTDIFELLVLKESQYNKLAKAKIEGTISEDHFDLLESKIVADLIKIANQIPEDGAAKLDSYFSDNQFYFRIARREREKQTVIKKILLDALKKRKSRHFMTDFNDAVLAAYEELVTNALRHGCNSLDDTIAIQFEVVDLYVSLVVENPREIDFLLGKKIQEGKARIKKSPDKVGGRGLVLVSELADDFFMPDNKSLKCVFYDDMFACKAYRINNRLVLVDVRSGISNPAFAPKLMDFFEQLELQELDAVILSFHRFSVQPQSTSIISVTLSIKFEMASLNVRLVAMLNEGKDRESLVKLPDMITATSWGEALEKVGQLDSKADFLNFIDTHKETEISFE